MGGLAFAELHDDVPGNFETVLEAQNCMNKAVDGLFRAFYLCDGKTICPCWITEAMLTIYERVVASLLSAP